jgi:hypothetical protein
VIDCISINKLINKKKNVPRKTPTTFAPSAAHVTLNQAHTLALLRCRMPPGHGDTVGLDLALHISHLFPPRL